MDKPFLPIQLPSEEEFSKECSEKSLFINDDMSRAYTNTIYEVESNNSMGSADSISLSSGRNAALTSSSDVDWFSFKVPSSGEYRFDISNIASNYDYDMELFSSQNVSLGSSATSESYETIITTLQGNQTVYLRVYPYSPSTSSQKYYVTVTNDAMALLNWTYTFNGSDPKRNVTSPYGNRSSGAHYGVDISASGTDIYSSTDGIKKYGGSDMSGSMGYYAVVQVDSSQAPAGYGNSTMVTYMHMNSPSPLSNN